MNPLEPVRAAVTTHLKQIAAEIPAIHSLSIVGSFADADALHAVADIDVIVIVNELRSAEFDTIVTRFNRIAGSDLGLPDHRVRVNPTFGPLKFDDADTVVFHVMVYDLAGHRDHVIKSPFTCLDWERHDALHGPALRDIYSAGGAQPLDIIASRRGIDAYLADLAAGEISYREYDLSGETPRQVARARTLDTRHTVEYAYHILRNLFLNTCKVLTGTNRAAEGSALLAEMRQHIALSPEDGEFFLALHRWKRRGGPLPERAVETTTAIVRRFHAGLEHLVAAAPRVIFARHGRTGDNDGSFLGVRRDPVLLHPADMPEEEQQYLRELQDATTAVARIYASPLARARESAALCGAARDVTVDTRLQEIDYGAAEGLHVGELAARHPEVPAGWANGTDPPFPEGECQADVARRLTAFIAQHIVPAGESACVITHNVVLRTLLGRVFAVPVQRWYRLQPRHLEPIAFRVIGESLVPELSAEQRTRFRDQLFSGSVAATSDGGTT